MSCQNSILLRREEAQISKICSVVTMFQSCNWTLMMISGFHFYSMSTLNINCVYNGPGKHLIIIMMMMEKIGTALFYCHVAYLIYYVWSALSLTACLDFLPLFKDMALNCCRCQCVNVIYPCHRLVSNFCINLQRWSTNLAIKNKWFIALVTYTLTFTRQQMYFCLTL